MNNASTENPITLTVVRKGQLPFPEWRSFWSRIVKTAKIEPDRTALSETTAGIRAEQQVLAAFDQFSHKAAPIEFIRRHEAYVSGVDDGSLPLNTTFNHSLDSVTLEFRRTVDTMNIVLARRCQRTRPAAKRLLRSILQPIAAAREKLELAETDSASDFGAPHKPTDKLLILISAEQDIQRAIDNIDVASPHASSRGILTGLVPPGLID